MPGLQERRVNVISHFFFDSLRLFGLRDRLRCPKCSAIGTWKPHGGVFDRKDTRKERRWLCKWCGYYVGPEGVRRAEIGVKAWRLCRKGSARAPDTPRERCKPAWPWRG
jgi:hypothetical protein